MNKFLYKIIEIKPGQPDITADDLNALGEDGWELVSVLHPAGVGYSERYFFKLTNPVRYTWGA